MNKVLKYVLSGLGSLTTFVLYVLFKKTKAENEKLKAENKVKTIEKETEKVCSEERLNNQQRADEIKKKTDDEIFASWNK